MNGMAQKLVTVTAKINLVDLAVCGSCFGPRLPEKIDSSNLW